MVFLIIVAVAIIVLQVLSYRHTREIISKVEFFFPSTKDDVHVRLNSVNKDIINDEGSKLDDFLSTELKGELSDSDIAAKGEDPQNYIKVPLVNVDGDTSAHVDFKKTTKELNAYLCKNNDVTGADFEIIKDIYESHLKGMHSSIQNNLNTPLLLGLAGTFLGIIFGLLGLHLADDLSNIDSIKDLLGGVAVAMIASFIGLILTLLNTSIFYKKASETCEQNKENYFNLLRKELLPSISTTIEQGLTSLRSVLGHFVGSFGTQLQGYSDAFRLLNNNIQEEQKLISAIKQLDIAQTSVSIVKAFNKLKDASDSFTMFEQYQQSLCSTIKELSTSANNFNALIGHFTDFYNSLQIVINNQNVASDMQRRFVDAIEQHFPTGSEGRELWRNSFDLLVSDAKDVSEKLQIELQETTKYISSFINNNITVFNALNELPATMNTLSNYATLQVSCYNNLNQSISDLIEQQRKNQIETAEMNKSILEAMSMLNKAIKQIR